MENFVQNSTEFPTICVDGKCVFHYIYRCSYWNDVWLGQRESFSL